MGTFGGHVLPGSFFIVMSVWWTLSIFYVHFKSLKEKTRFRSSMTFPFLCLPRRLNKWPLETALKLLMVCIGLSVEIHSGIRNEKIKSLHDGQHATMYFFYGVASVMDLLYYYEAPIPKDLDYVSFIIAIGV
jgi:hypothetical protein